MASFLIPRRADPNVEFLISGQDHRLHFRMARSAPRLRHAVETNAFNVDHEALLKIMCPIALSNDRDSGFSELRNKSPMERNERPIRSKSPRTKPVYC